MTRRQAGAFVALSTLALLLAAGEAGAQWPRLSVLSAKLPASEVRAGSAGWESAIRERGLDPEEIINPFEVTPEMEIWAREVTRGISSPLVRLLALQRALFSQEEFVYDAELTLTAREAFERRSGNCLSFTVLFVALSRQIGYETFLISMPRVEGVNRDGDLVVVSNHALAGYPMGGRVHLYDFYLSTETFAGRYSFLNDLEGCSLFHTNLSVGLLREDELDAALQELELAIALDPDSLAAWVNLGVAWRRLGDPVGALAAYNTALGLDPGNPSALNNIAAMYYLEGRTGEARRALVEAAEESKSPYLLMALADLEMAGGNRGEARQWLRRARRLGATEDEISALTTKWEAQRAAGSPSNAIEGEGGGSTASLRGSVGGSGGTSAP